MFFASLIGSIQGDVLTKFVFVVLEPSGWFLVWFALDKIFYMSAEKQLESKFYDKMSKCDIFFTGK